MVLITLGEDQDQINVGPGKTELCRMRPIDLYFWVWLYFLNDGADLRNDFVFDGSHLVKNVFDWVSELKDFLVQALVKGSFGDVLRLLAFEPFDHPDQLVGLKGIPNLRRQRASLRLVSISIQNKHVELLLGFVQWALDLVNLGLSEVLFLSEVAQDIISHVLLLLADLEQELFKFYSVVVHWLNFQLKVFLQLLQLFFVMVVQMLKVHRGLLLSLLLSKIDVVSILDEIVLQLLIQRIPLLLKA